jgi:polyisoprenoid-binding protein YceI
MRYLSAVLALSACAFAQPVTWNIDSAHTAAQFSVKHMMVSTVRGGFGKVTGKVTFDPKNPGKDSSVDVTIDATAIDTREPKRDAHLKSPDFFDVEKFPTLTFKSTKVESAGAGKLKVTGDLTIHGVTKSVVLNVEGPAPELKDQRGGARTGATATATINRKDFGLTWNRAVEAGGVVVGDEVSITIDVEMLRK